MNGLSVVLVSVQALLFLVWAVLMFRMLIGLLGRYRAETGRRWIGPIAVWGVFGRFLTEADRRAERRWLGMATLALTVATVLLAVLRMP